MSPFLELQLNSDIYWLIALALSTLIILFYYFFYFGRVALSRSGQENSQQANAPVSVIICARNEYENLKKNLPIVLEQDYPDFEVVVVNDFSQDDSFYLLKGFQEKYDHFKVIHLRENVNFFEGKKLALAVGIKSAKHDTVLLTDADCTPAGKNWIKTMMAAFGNKTEIVLGYGGYKKVPGFLNKLIRFDTLSIALFYLGAALAGKAYMGVGRNLAYHRKAFFRHGGFASHYKIKSGDDDLFVNSAATPSNTAVVLNPEGYTFSDPKKDFVSWFKQKKRHLSTGTYYKMGDKIKLGIFTFFNTLFYPVIVLFLFFAQDSLSLLIALGLFLLKTISLMLVYYYAGKRVDEKKLFLYSPLFDFIFVLLNPLFAASNIFYKKNKWK